MDADATMKTERLIDRHGAPIALGLAVGALAAAVVGWRYQITWSSTDPCEQPAVAPGIAALGFSLFATAVALGAAMYGSFRVRTASVLAAVAILASVTLIGALVQGMTCKY